ncbi:MAG TPA: CHAD domain-containing protein [Chloroflexi bacterium]|nr:CHAD domain-containing protein [Chloroflexota bacterium]
MEERLSADERALLSVIARHRNPALARRAQIVLGWDEALEADQIAGRVGLSERTVNRWLRAFFERGLEIFPAEVLSEALPEAQQSVQAALAESGQPSTGAEVLATERPRLSVADLCQRYHVDMAHGRYVGQLAVELFNLTQPIHQLDHRYRDVIFAAGLLHNVALAGGTARHHTRGRDIILENPLSDLDDADRALIAVTTAFHRKAWKSSRLEKEPSYTALPAAMQPVALVLSALIRIADGLDYSQSQTTILGQSRVGPEGVLVTVAGPFSDIDAARADQKADLWRAMFETPITIRPYSEAAILLEEPVSRKPELPETPGLQPDDLMSEAGRKVLRLHFERLLYHEPGTRRGHDIEALHDMRVATRRMRAAFRVFGPYFEKRTRRRLLRGLRRTGRALGHVRDLDVFMAYAQQYLAGLPAARQHELDVLMGYWRERRAEARDQMLAYLDSTEYTDFVEAFREFVETPGLGSKDVDLEGPIPRHVMYVAPRLIYTRYEAVRAYEPLLQDAPIATLHALRIDAKRLRYTLEFFREVLGEEAGEVIKAVVGLQDHLGALHDADVACSLLQRYMKKLLKQTRRQAGSARLSDLGGIVAYLESREQEMEHLSATFPEAWERVVAPETRRRLALAVSVL